MIRRIIVGAILSLFGAVAAHAGGTCTPSSAGIAFGPVSSSRVSSVGFITLTCTGSGTIDYTVTLSTGASGTYAMRQMKNSADSLVEGLFGDPAYTQVWGDGSGGSTIVTGTVEIFNQPNRTVRLPVYARLQAQTAPVAGTYADTIIASVDTSQGTETASFPVTATLQQDCTISATDLVFGSYSGSQLDGQSQISLTCTNGLPWNIGLNQGALPGATVVTRKMAGSGTPMAYSLYRDAARTLNWGDTVGEDTVSGTGSGSVQTVPVYGRVPGLQTLPAGSYQDTILATVAF